MLIQAESKLMINPQDTENTVRHIEIKAYVDDYQSLCTRVSELALQWLHGESKSQVSNSVLAGSQTTTLNIPTDRVQEDTFFNCRSGRLKLRSSGQFHDLIYYRRENDYGPSESFYQSARTKNPAALRTSLSSAFGEAGRVKKFRRTYRIGGSIIHLDRVGGLGDFIEIKVELNATETQPLAESRVFSPALVPTHSAEKGAQMIENLMSELNVDLFQLVDGAYVDLINERTRA